MKKYLLSCLLFLSFLVCADDKAVLQSRLAKLTQFNATFTQKNTIDGDEHQAGEGELWLQRPTSFAWKMIAPESYQIISNGETIWYYTPEIEQVTLYSLKNAVNNDLLLLLTDNQEPLWNQYRVQRQRDQFTLSSQDDSDRQFVIGILPTGILTDLTVIEHKNERTQYTLYKQNSQPIPPSTFQFVIPKGVMIDDQR